MEEIIAFCKHNAIETKQGELMKNYTSFKVGGEAELMIFPKTQVELSALLLMLEKTACPKLILGRGTNILVRDGGISGVVISTRGDCNDKICQLQENKIYCPAGKKLSDICLFAMENGLSGLEFAWGIPGSVGGAVYMNAGAYSKEVKDVIFEASYFDNNGKLCSIEMENMDLSYRHSVFSDNKKFYIQGAVFKLVPGERAKIKARMDEIFEMRRSKQPLEYPSAGSTFKRPEGAFASALIDKCGLKGFCVGGAMVSEKHAGFVINYDNASCSDIISLMQQVRQIVQEKTGFVLEPEVEIVGKDL